MRYLAAFLSVWVTGAVQAQPAPTKALRVLVLPYRVDARVPVEAQTADTILVSRMGKLHAFSLLSQDELGQVAGFESMRQQLGVSNDEQALLTLGRMADADRLISGTLGDVGGTTAATLVLVNVHTGEVERRLAGTARGQRDLIIPLLNQQADALAAHILRTYVPERVGVVPQEALPAVAAPVVVVHRGFSYLSLLALSSTGAGLALALSSVISAGLIGWWAPDLKPTWQAPGPLPFYAIFCAVSLLGAGIAATVFGAAVYAQPPGQDG